MKKIIYLISTTVLTLQLSFLLHSFIEAKYIDWAIQNAKVLSDTHFLGFLYCVLPWWLSHGLLVAGLISGYFLGQTWWRIVYVEKRHWRMRKDLK